MKRPEQTLQIQVANYLRVALRPPTFWTSLDHAAKLGPVAGAMRKKRGVRAGLPDLLVMRACDFSTVVIGIELKATKGVVSDAQEEMKRSFKAVNADYYVCRTLPEVLHVLEMNGIPLHAKLS
jgi:hypothetical protein